MRDLEDFYPFVELLVPEADPLHLQEATREAIIRFMRDSQVFTDYLTLPVQDKVCEYVLDVPECRVIVGIIGVTIDGMPTDEWQRDDHEDVILFRDAPGRCCTEVKYSWTIGRDDCEIPEKVYQDYLPLIQQAAIVALHKSFQSKTVSASRAADADYEYHTLLNDVMARKIYNFSHTRPRMHRPGRRRSRGW